MRLKKPKPKKHKCRIRNWSDYKIVFYNTALVQRGSLCLWLDKTTLQNWRNQERIKKRGKPKVYSNQAKSTVAKRLPVLCGSARSTICLCGRWKGCWLLLWLWQEPKYGSGSNKTARPRTTPIKPPIDPGCPCQNGYVESIHSRLRDELLNREAFASVQEARVQLETHRHWYNKERPHSSLKYLPPATFRQQWQTRKMDGLEERPPD